MSLQPEQLVQLLDGQSRELGQVAIERIEGDLIFGRFTPGSDFSEVEHLFAEYVEAANEQLLSVVGELDQAIRALGLHLGSANGAVLSGIDDVQISAGSITFRVQLLLNSTVSAGQALRF